jgi:tripartite ATP-independent transporter DctM subunit
MPAACRLPQPDVAIDAARLSTRWLRRVEAVLGAVCTLLLASLLCVVLATVILRYGFRTGFPGSEDLATWLHIALIAFGAPLTLGSTLTMRLDSLVVRLPARAQSVCAVSADIFTVLAGLALAFGSGRIVTMLGGISPTLGLPEWVRFGFLGVGGALTLLVLALRRLAEGRCLALLAAFVVGAVLHVAARHAAIAVPLPASAVLALIAAIGLVVAAPLPHAFLAAAYLAIAFGSPLPEPAVVSTTVAGMSKFLLLAIPFFLLAGALLTASGTAARIVRFAAALVGHRRAGLAQTTLLTSVLFSGASGSSVANAAFGAATFQPELVKRGYPPAQAGAIVASASVLDNVIPPSIAFLILAAATNLSVGSLLVGGFIAGAVMASCLAIAIHFTAHEHIRKPRASTAERWTATLSALPAFGLGVIVVVGIRMGVVTTTEAAALAALYALALGLGARLNGRRFHAIFRQAAVEASAIGLLIGTAAPFAFLLAIDDVSGLLVAFVKDLAAAPWGVMIVINLLLLAIGLVLDIGAAILLFAPIFLPLAVAVGVDPIHFGVILVVNLMIGGLTPPVGMLVFVVSGVTRVPAGALFLAILPYLAALLAALGLLIAGALLL